MSVVGVQLERPAQQFFAHLFPADLGGYVRFCLWVQGESRPRQECWLPTDEVCQLTECPLSSSGAGSPAELYFCPHTYQQANVDQPYATHTLWLDSNDSLFVPEDISRTPPTAVVASSPNRTHSYWLLDDPTDVRQAEALNLAIASEYNQQGYGGWQVHTLLRVPGTTNHKYKRNHKVRFKTWRYARSYALEDFATVPRPALSDAAGTPPPDHALPPLSDIMSVYKNAFSTRFRDLLKVRQRARHDALKALIHECQTTHIDVQAAYVLLRTSPNNVYADARFNGDRDLWREINRQYESNYNPGFKRIRQALDNIKSDATKTVDVKADECAEHIYGVMASEGRLLYVPTQGKSFYYHDNKLLELTRQSQDCRTFLHTQAQVNGASTLYNHLIEALRAKVQTNGQEVGLHDLAYYDQDDGWLYVSDNQGSIHRLPPTDDPAHLVENGTDGIFFRAKSKAAPFSPTPTESSPDLLDELLFDRLSMNIKDYPQERVRFILKAWFTALFFDSIFDTRPLLIVEGSPGSGKSTLFKMFEWLLRGPSGRIYSVPPSANIYRETVREHAYIFFDGVDEPFRKFADLLSITATGTTDRRRRLYSDGDTVEYPLRAFVGITCMDASKFLRNDLADRSVYVKARRRSRFTPEAELRHDIIANRDAMWSCLLQHLHRITRQLAKPATKRADSRLRMADFGRLLRAQCEVYGEPYEDYETFLLEEQAARVFEKQPLWSTLDLWLTTENQDRYVTSGELHRELQELSSEHAVDYPCRNSQSLVSHLKRLAAHIDLEQQHGTRQKTYRIRRLA